MKTSINDVWFKLDEGRKDIKGGTVPEAIWVTGSQIVQRIYLTLSDQGARKHIEALLCRFSSVYGDLFFFEFEVVCSLRISDINVRKEKSWTVLDEPNNDHLVEEVAKCIAESIVMELNGLAAELSSASREVAVSG
jgi:hypothetical protein